MNNDIKQFIGQHIKISDEILNIFNNLLTYSELDPLDFFTKSGDFPVDFIIIKTGVIRSFTLNEKGIESTRAFLSTGDIAGANSAMMKNENSTMNYQALTKITGYKGNFYDLMKLTEKHHELSIFYIKALENAYLKVENIIIEISSLTTTERYLELNKRIPGIHNLIKQKYIASYLNISTVQLSRIRRKLTEN